MRHPIFWLCFLYFVSVMNCDFNLELKIDYYEKLIKRGIQEAVTHKFRQNNSDFFENIVDEYVYDYGIYDFIIVGAGSSGSVVANRLSENKNWTILVLEAGNEENDLSEIPGLHAILPTSNKNWGYTTTSQKYGCYGMVDRRCPYARGKSIGGSGAINGVVYLRGHKKSYDKWQTYANPGWTYKNISHYFKKSENSQIPDGDEGCHGFAGPVNNAYTSPEPTFFQAFFDANMELGAKYIDVDGRHSEGVGKCQSSVLFGKRVSGGSSYLRSARNRVNLKVTIQAFVTKIIIDKQTMKTEGVHFVKNRVRFRATAMKEVILSGGVINTPQLLMLSGIGPRQELEKHKIEVIKDSPVGQTTRDQIAFNHVYFRTNHTAPEEPLRNQISDYLQGFGSLTTSFSWKAMSFKRFNNIPVEFVITAPSRASQGIKIPRNYNPEADEAVESFNGTTDFLISIILFYPKSRGKITLKSNDPKDFPEIDIGIFSAEEDIEIMYEAIKYAHKLGRTQSFQRFNATPFFKLKPCDHFGFNTKGFWICAMRHLSFNGYHMTSTAKMGPKEDPMAVVDNELKVYGIQNLRIVDCSIIPDIISGHTNAVAFAVGEKASDIIRNYYGFR